MAALLFRCPATGHTVQGWRAADLSDHGGETYEATDCIACGGQHLVNHRTGKTLGAGEAAPRAEE